MVDYVIGDEYVLPSHGKFYDVPVNDHVKLRSMTTNEEMRRLNVSENQYKPMADIIDECLIDKPGISSYDMCLGDYQFLMYKLRITTYGADYPLECRCPYCLSTFEEHVNLEDLPVREFDKSILEHKEFDLPRTKHHIKIRLQTPRILDTIARQENEEKKRRKSSTASSEIIQLSNIVEEIDGERPDPFFAEDFYRNLPMMDTKVILRHEERLSNEVGLGTDLTVTCPVCNNSYNSSFRVTSEFFDPSLDI